MAVPRFGQERIKDIPPLNLLDALYAQGIPEEFLRQMIGKPTPEITSAYLSRDMDRYALDRAVRMAQGEEIERLGKTTNEYDRLYGALEMRGVTMSNYRGEKTAQALAQWASTHANPQVLGNALATALPQYRNLGGIGVDDQARRGVTLFSNPQTQPAPLGPTVGMQPGVRGQGGMGGGRDAGPGAPTITGTTPAPTTPGAGGAGPGAGGSPPPVKLTPAQIRADIESRYGWAAAFMDIPEIANILNLAANGDISAEEANARWLASDYYKSTSVNQRNWRILEKTNSGQAAVELQGQIDSIRSKAQALGVTVSEDRIRQIATMSKQFGWSDQMINGALASEVKWDPDGAKTGVMAQIKGAQQSQLVPMSDQAMGQWATAIVSGAKTVEDFQAYLKDQAKSLFPSMANYLDTTPGGTVKTYLNPYGETIAKTMGMNAADIDWMDPKYFRFVNNVDPKTGERRVMDLADVQRTLIADPQYGYDRTNNGKQAKAGLARTILEQWGFLAPAGSGGSFG